MIIWPILLLLFACHAGLADWRLERKLELETVDSNSSGAVITACREECPNECPAGFVYINRCKTCVCLPSENMPPKVNLTSVMKHIKMNIKRIKLGANLGRRKCRKKKKCKRCVNGYVINKRGCQTCRCRKSRSPVILNRPESIHLGPFAHLFSRGQCQPLGCLCPYGHSMGSNGCKTCQCLTEPKLVPEEGCPQLKCQPCKYGYAHADNGCGTCVCLSQMSTTVCPERSCGQCMPGLETFDIDGCRLCFCKEKFPFDWRGLPVRPSDMATPVMHALGVPCPFVMCANQCGRNQRQDVDKRGCPSCKCVDDNRMVKRTCEPCEQCNEGYRLVQMEDCECMCRLVTTPAMTEATTVVESVLTKKANEIGDNTENRRCSFQTKKHKGVLYSPNFPGNYPNGTNCKYILELQNPKRRRMVVELDTDFNGTYFDGFHIQGNFYGNYYSNKRLRFMTYGKVFEFFFNSTFYGSGPAFKIWFSYRRSRHCPTSLTCPVSCIYGYKRDRRGCMICECADRQESTTPIVLTTTRKQRREPKRRKKPRKTHNEAISKNDIGKSDLIHYLESLSAVSKRIIQEVKYLKTKSQEIVKKLQKTAVLKD